MSDEESYVMAEATYEPKNIFLTGGAGKCEYDG